MRGLKHLQEINEVISIIQDGQWHPLGEIITKTTLSKPTTKRILRFLANYSFIHLNNENKEVKITESLQNFLKDDPAF